jgi:hypothetical protein
LLLKDFKSFFLFLITLFSSICKSHFSDNKIAIGLIAGISAKIIFIITMIGTDRIIPGIHHIFPQSAREVIKNNGLIFNLFPIN